MFIKHITYYITVPVTKAKVDPTFINTIELQSISPNETANNNGNNKYDNMIIEVLIN